MKMQGPVVRHRIGMPGGTSRQNEKVTCSTSANENSGACGTSENENAVQLCAPLSLKEVACVSLHSLTIILTHILEKESKPTFSACLLLGRQYPDDAFRLKAAFFVKWIYRENTSKLP